MMTYTECYGYVEPPEDILDEDGCLRWIVEWDMQRPTWYSSILFPIGIDMGRYEVHLVMRDTGNLLVGGEKGAGVASLLRMIVTYILYVSRPMEARLILLDSPEARLSVYDGIPNLAYPVVQDGESALALLCWLEREMKRRYALFQGKHQSDFCAYNGASFLLPQLFLVVGDLSMLMQANAELAERKLTQLLRYGQDAGIHILLVTETTQTNVLTESIRANCPSKIAFRMSKEDSRIFLNQDGAEELADGEMLCYLREYSRPFKIVYQYTATESEIARTVEWLTDQGIENSYAEAVASEIAQMSQDDPETSG